MRNKILSTTNTDKLSTDNKKQLMAKSWKLLIAITLVYYLLNQALSVDSYNREKRQQSYGMGYGMGWSNKV